MHQGFFRCPDCSGVGNIVAGIVAIIDSGENEVRLVVNEEGGKAHLHAVRRLPVTGVGGDAIYRIVHPLYCQRPPERHALRHAAHLRFRRHDRDTPHFQSGFRQQSQIR